MPGGELLNTELIEDYIGFESVLGRDLALVVQLLGEAERFLLELLEPGRGAIDELHLRPELGDLLLDPLDLFLELIPL